MQNGDAENKKRLVPLNFGKHHKLIALGLGNRPLPEQRPLATIPCVLFWKWLPSAFFQTEKAVWKRSGRILSLNA